MKYIILLLTIYCSPAIAQDSVKTNNKPHKLEITASAGYNFNNKLSGNILYPFRSEKWSIKDMPTYSIHLGCFVGKHVCVGGGFSYDQWSTTVAYVEPLPGHGINYSNGNSSGITAAYTIHAFGNYDVSIRNGFVFAGATAGLTKSTGSTSLDKKLYTGRGYQLNGHIGYRVPLVKGRFWINAESGYTVTVIDHVDKKIPFLKNSKYSVSSPYAMAGLMFRL